MRSTADKVGPQFPRYTAVPSTSSFLKACAVVFCVLGLAVLPSDSVTGESGLQSSAGASRGNAYGDFAAAGPSDAGRERNSAELPAGVRVARDEGEEPPDSVAGFPEEDIETDALVRVEVKSPQDWEILRSLGAALYFTGDGYAVVTLRQDGLSELSSKRLSWRLLSPTSPGSLYYFIPDRGASPATLPDVLLLDEDSGGLLVSASREAVSAARALGFKAVPLSKPWPIRADGFLDLDFAHDTVEQNLDYKWILSTVNQDTLGAFIKHLEDYGTRYTYSPEILKSGEWLLDRLWGFGYSDTVFQGVLLDDGKITVAPGNVMATKVGTTIPDVHILVGGHYDSISDAVASGRAPGADDNASGTAGALEIARVLADVDLDASVQFVLFTAEEQGMLGSAEFVRQLEMGEVPPEKLFFINMDMIGNSASFPWSVQIFYDTRSRPLADLAAMVAEAYTEVDPILGGYMGLSDQAPFWQAGYPALFFHERDFSDHYHAAHDLLEHLEMDYEAEVVKAVLGTVLHLANKADPPENLTAAELVSGELSVGWSRSSDADVLGYHLEVLSREGELLSKIFTKETSALLSPEHLRDGVSVRVRAEDVLGESDASDALFVGGDVVAAKATPNPTSGPCRFSIFVPGAGPSVNVVVHLADASGRLVHSLDAGLVGRGALNLDWNGELADGSLAPPGVYFFKVEADGVGTESGKVIVVR